MNLKYLAAYFFTISLVILSAQPFTVSAHRQDNENVGAEGTEKPLFKKAGANGGNACYVYKQYVVMTITSGDVGEDISIYKRNGATDAQQECDSAGQTPYMSLKNGGESYFYGITGNKFLVDSGTSAGIRGLDIVSLTTKKVVFSTKYQNDIKVFGNTIVYSKPSQTKGLLKNCPSAKKWRKEGGGVGWAHPTKIDLTTLKETSAGRLACVYVE
ncbi:MAG: hypothetical protein ACR2L1_09050 [Pyrinomonadaceae bacterium]